MVRDVLRDDVTVGSLMEMLCAYDLLLCEESLDEVMDKFGRCKNPVKGKILRMNVGKTEGMQLLFGKRVYGCFEGGSLWCLW